MNSKYKDINFDAFDTEPDQVLKEQQKSEYINNFYKSIGMNQSTREYQGASIKRFSRKFIAIAAAMIMVLAFGAVAYATDFFGLGIVKHYDMAYETPFREDSKQFKAQSEYEEYFASLSESEKETYSTEWLAIQNEINEKVENQWEDRMTLPIGYTENEREAITKISKKYGLKMNEYEYHTTSITDAFSKSNIPNFMGSSKEIVDSLVSDEFVGADGFICGDAGTLSMGLGNGLWDINIYPSDVFPGIPSWSDDNTIDSDKDQTSEQWAFTTKDGLKVKAEMTTLRKINAYYFVYGTDDYTMTFRMMRFGNAEADKDIPILTKAEFEDIINSFDLDKL